MQCSNARLLSSGGFGHLNDLLNFNNSVFIAQLKACFRVPGVEQVQAVWPLQIPR